VLELNASKASSFNYPAQASSHHARLLLEKEYQVVAISLDHELGSFSNLIKLGIQKLIAGNLELTHNEG
jgi:hypothetical protein